MFHLFKKHEVHNMYYIGMTDSQGESCIIGMTEKRKYAEAFINFFFRGSKNYFIAYVTDTPKDPDLFTIIKFSKKNGIYIPMWMLQYIEKEFERTCKGMISSIRTFRTICKNNNDTAGVRMLQDVEKHFFTVSESKDDDDVKDTFFQDYVAMHWISIVPFDDHKMRSLHSILQAIEYSHDMDIMYKNRIDLYYT